MKKVLFVNPPIYDFSAYDFWSKPYGLLRIAGYLRGKVQGTFFDFMDRKSSFLEVTEVKPDRDSCGRGGYLSQIVEKPSVYSCIERYYRRFGVREEKFVEVLKNDNFDVVFITSEMTYWYLGIKEVIKNIRYYQPKAKILLGGIYATLCSRHAKTLGADYVFEGNIYNCSNLEYVEKLLEVSLDFAAIPYWEAYQDLSYGILKLNDGCPLSCSYCSVKKFYPHFEHRSLSLIFNEIDLLLGKNVKNIAFYDDALLVDPDKNLFPTLAYVKNHGVGIQFYAPNAVHVKLINSKMAERLKHFGFKKIFLGFESSSFNWQKATGGEAGIKTGIKEFEKAAEVLHEVGFKSSDLTAYLMVGHPKQTETEVVESINFVSGCGIKVMLAEYSPIPDTPDGESCAKFVDLSEPLFHNNSVFPLFTFGKEKMQKIKDLVRNKNKEL